jgi:hypothetical protein
MDETPSYRPFLIPTILLLAGGWGGLYLLLNYTEPDLWPRWGFFALVVLACTGVALPLVYLLNRLIPSNPLVEPRVITRQATWFGVYFAVLAWLSIGRILNFSIGLWLALGFAAIEYLLRTRETVPTTPHNDAPSQPPLR